MDNFKTLYEACLELIESWVTEKTNDKPRFFNR